MVPPLQALRRRLARPDTWVAAGPALAVAAVLAFVYRDVLFGGRALIQGDAALVHWPVRAHFVDRLLSGEWPEWYPFDGLGTSYFGTAAAGLLHPSVALHLVLPHGLALSLGAVLAHAFAAAGTFRLLRLWRCSPQAALAGALAFMLSGYLTSMDARPAYLFAAASVPWAVLALEVASVPLCAASMALIALSGERLHTLVFASLLLAVLALTHRARRRALSTLLVAGGVALLASAAQWLPALSSLDSGSVGGAEARLWSFNPLRLVEFLTPGFLSLPGGESPVVLYQQSAFGSFWAASVFLGAPVLALASVAARRSAMRRPRVVLVAFAVFALLVSLGQGARAPVFEALQWIPGLALLRYPERTVLFVVWPAACLAGLGAEAVLSEATRAKAHRLLVLSLVALLVLQVGLLLGASSLEAAALALAGADSEAARDELRRLVPSLRAGLFSGAVLTAVSLGLGTAVSAVRRRPSDATLVAGLVLVPLLVACEPFRAWRADPAVVLPRPGAAARIAASPGGPGYGRSRVYAYYSAQQPRCSEGPLCSEIPLSYRTLPFFGLENSLGYLPMTSTGRPALAEKRLPSTVYFRGFNVRYAVPQDAQSAGRADTSGLLEDPGAGERIRLVKAIPVGSTAEALEVANAPGFDVVRTVPVETTDASHPATAPTNASVAVRRYAPEQTEVEVASETPCTLFVGDAYAPGWSATVDGRPAAILPGLVTGRALALEAGRHRVEMTYRTPGLRLGLALSALGWALVAALALTPRVRSGAGAAAGTPPSP